MWRILSVALLLSVFCASSAGNWRHPSRRFPPPCCVALSTADIRKDVIGTEYRKPVAKPPCLEAIILTTRQGPVCVNPNTQWVQRLTGSMKRL